MGNEHCSQRFLSKTVAELLSSVKGGLSSEMRKIHLRKMEELCLSVSPVRNCRDTWDAAACPDAVNERAEVMSVLRVHHSFLRFPFWLERGRYRHAV